MDKMMNFDVKKNYEDTLYLYNCEYNNIKDIINYCESYFLKEDENYKRIIIYFLENCSEIDQSQFNCDNIFLIDSKNILYTSKKNGKEIIGDLVNVINIDTLRIKEYIVQNKPPQIVKNEEDDDEIECNII